MFHQYKPIGASPRRDYVLTRMVLLYKYNLVLYFMVRNDTLKKGGNAPRATDEKRFLSSASLILKYLVQYCTTTQSVQSTLSCHLVVSPVTLVLQRRRAARCRAATVVVPHRRRVAHRLRFAASSCRPSPSSCRPSP